jgi:hypothetical protein
MFAEGVRDISRAAAWTWKAIEFARQIPSAWNVVRLQGWYAMPAALLADDFLQAAKLATVMTEGGLDSITATIKESTNINATDRISPFEALAASAPPGAQESSLLVVAFLPIAVRLAFLGFRGKAVADTALSLAGIESVIPPDLRSGNFVAEMRRALVNEIDWHVLQDAGFHAIQSHEYLRGYVLCIGAIDKAPVAQSLYLQTFLAQQLEGFSKMCPSIYREIVAPFFVAYWERMIAQSAGLFRTSLTHTQRQLHSANGSSDGTRQLLSAMTFCLGVTLPDHTMKWLEPSP